jgi:transglutaminase-like putative cysteine protease
VRRSTEWALLALTLATIAGFGRLFTEGFFWQLALVALYSHGAASLCRTRGLGVLASALVCAAGLVPLLTCVFFWGESTFGLPGPAVWGAADTALADAWRVFSDVVAPTAPLTGFLVTTAVAVSVAAFLADWAAFRLWSPYEAVVPTATLFVFGALLGRGGHVVAAGLFAAAGVVFVLLHRVERLDSGSWVGEATSARGSLVSQGVAIASVALLVGVIGGPLLPGADSPPVIDVRGGGDGSSRRVTVSPLVDIRQRLVEQSDAVVFTVEADSARYWRLTSLDIFDGEIWRSGGKYKEASTELPSGAESAASRTAVTQSYEIDALSALWLPAAYEPRSLDPADDARYQAESGTLIVDTDIETSDGYAYTVVSEVPSFDPEELRNAPPPSPEVVARFAVEPRGFSDASRQEARTAVGGATTDYDRARALQDWFQMPGNFRYDLEAQPGHGATAIDAFLASRVGYCEQFAGTFAAMARDLGIPARVAVGFTPGDLTGDTYVVRGKHAHAWPEVWFEGFGWVPFEPTPGRGMPEALAWTGLTPDQADADGTGATSTTAPEVTSPTTTPDTAPVAPFADLETAPDAGGSGTTGSGDGLHPVLSFARIPLALAILYLLAVPALLALRRTRRRAGAAEPAQRVLLAWDEALEVARIDRRWDETYLELADRAGDRYPYLRRDLRVLADQATAADFWTVEPAAASEAEDAAAGVATAVTDRTSTWERLLRAEDARRLLRPRRRS